MGLRKEHPWREFFPYAGAQIVGGCVGTLVAHGMFELPLLELAVKARSGPAQWFAEFVATFGLIVTILAVSRFRSEAIPVAVGLYITAAYWFTASTSFANPAVTIARAFTDSFSGIAPADVPMFIVAQFAGALAGLALMRWFLLAEPVLTDLRGAGIEPDAQRGLAHSDALVDGCVFRGRAARPAASTRSRRSPPPCRASKPTSAESSTSGFVNAFRSEPARRA